MRYVTWQFIHDRPLQLLVRRLAQHQLGLLPEPLPAFRRNVELADHTQHSDCGLPIRVAEHYEMVLGITSNEPDLNALGVTEPAH